MHERSAEFPDIHLEDFIASLTQSEKDNLCKETFKKKHVHCIHTEGYKIHQWQAYTCLYCELNTSGNTYFLSSGNWYKVAGDFVAKVNQAYAGIPSYQRTLPKYKDDSESQYNERIVREMAGQFALMDKKDIPHGGGQSKVEFCDLYSRDKDIIHVKRYGASSVLSHLFSQGSISGDLFQMDKEFREKVSQKLPVGFKIINCEERPRNNEYQIVYAIISDVPGELDIPYFSRLNLKNSARTISGLGYRVAKLKIDVDPVKAKLRKYRIKKKAQ